MDEKKEKKAAPAGHPVKEGLVIFLFLLLIVALLSRFSSSFDLGQFSFADFNLYIEKLTGGANGWYENLLYFLNFLVGLYVRIATVFSAVAFLVIIYVTWLASRLAAENKKKDKMATVAKEAPSEQSQKWSMVLSHVNSQNAAEWRLSILEADVMLDDLMQSLGYHGESLGEKLKNADEADFKTINAAWDAHKVRNAIAHQGADFRVSQHEARRVIVLYGNVFKEFHYV